MSDDANEINTTIVVAIGNEGIEGAVDLSLTEDDILNILKTDGFSKKVGNTLQALMLRARLNSHRNIELYGFRTHLTIDELFEHIDANYNGMVDLIRRKGVTIPI